MKIGDVEIRGKAALAPLAGFTDPVFRSICREHGAALSTTEMVSARGLAEGHERSCRYLTLAPDEHPVAVQVYGADPEVMAEGARVAATCGTDIIDINCGCPVKKIVSKRAGSALLKDPDLLGRIVSAVEGAVGQPVTVKIRSGWDDGTQVAQIARVVEDSGAAAIAVHGRSRSAGFSGEADWGAIRDVKEAVGIPVIGNGDVRRPEDAREMISCTGCDMVMIGRGAVGNPWLFERTEAYLDRGILPPEPTPAERIRVAKHHLGLSVAAKGGWYGVREMRRHLSAYVKGMRGAAEIRRELMTQDDPDGVQAVLDKFLERTNAVLAEELRP